MSNYKNKDVLQVLGRNVRFAREKKDLKIEEMAVKAKCHRESLSRLEYGEQDIQLCTAVRIAEVLNVPLPELFSRNFRDQNWNSISGFVDDDFLLIFSENAQQSLQFARKYQTSLQSSIGMDAATVSRILNGKVHDPRITTLDCFAKGLDKDLKSMFVRSEERGKK